MQAVWETAQVLWVWGATPEVFEALLPAGAFLYQLAIRAPFWRCSRATYENSHGGVLGKRGDGKRVACEAWPGNGNRVPAKERIQKVV